MDTDRVPARRGPVQWVLVGLLKAYRLLLSPWIGSQCRFEPTCSRYAIEAIESHGSGKGVYLAGRRLLRCHPWCQGGYDPVPPAAWSHPGSGPAERSN